MMCRGVRLISMSVLVLAAPALFGQENPPPNRDQDQGPRRERRTDGEQRREGDRRDRFRGRGGFSPSAMVVTLAMNAEVAKALELTDEQKKYLDLLREQIRDEDREFFSSMGEDTPREERFQKMREYQAKRAPEVDTHLKEILGEAKLTRLKEVRLQAFGTMALMSPDVQKEVEMTDSQREQMQTAMREVFGSMRDRFRGGRRGGGEGDGDSRRQAMEEMRKEMESKLMTILTDKQKERWAKMVGEPANIDMEAVRRSMMPGPPRGRERGNRPGSETERPQT